MKAIVLRAIGEPETLRLEDVPDPVPTAGQVVVRLRAAALNHRDLFICRGQYAGIRFPTILGSDGVGEIAGVGPGVTGVRPGDAVIINPSLDWGDDLRIEGSEFRILGLPDNGTFAEMVAVPAENVSPCPQGLSAEEAAALPLAGMTAYRAVATRGRVQRGETVLVTGIGGGVATFALLIARHAGARVLVTSGSDAKLERARALGAEGGFNYQTSDWVKAAKAATGGAGPDLIIDGAGGAVFDQAMDALRPGGRVVTYGGTLGPVPELVVRRVFWKQLDIHGTKMGSPEDFRGMLALFGEKGLRPVVDRVFPLAEAGQALAHMAQRSQFGKIALRIA
ncbi:MAG TPA: zinc-binding dehydrogenase [bacterium]|nr:zinc-binding dehydrogenase [bacterium]